MEKVKLMCSYGGRIQRRPHDLQHSYNGGHTKILTVDRNINFTTLVSKLQNLCECNDQIQVKYKLPGQDVETLISVFDDDDVNHMMFEYDNLRRVSVKPARFRLFLFFSATAKPRLLNPDFLFGFDKEYSVDHEYSTSVGTRRIPDSAGGNGAPDYNPGIHTVRFGYRIPGM